MFLIMLSSVCNVRQHWTNSTFSGFCKTKKNTQDTLLSLCIHTLTSHYTIYATFFHDYTIEKVKFILTCRLTFRPISCCTSRSVMVFVRYSTFT